MTDCTTRRGYVFDDGGMLTLTTVACINGQPVDYLGLPYPFDGLILTLTGWPDAEVMSFAGGRLLVGGLL